MKRLLLLPTLMMLLSCSATPSPATPSIKGCSVPRWPIKPKLTPTVCGESVCLPPGQVIALVRYQTDVDLVQAATVRCSLIQWVAE